MVLGWEGKRLLLIFFGIRSIIMFYFIFIFLELRVYVRFVVGSYLIGMFKALRILLDKCNY